LWARDQKGQTMFHVEQIARGLSTEMAARKLARSFANLRCIQGAVFHVKRSVE
jgi:hypothetical protein